MLAEFGPSAFLDIELKVAGNEEEIVAAVHAHSPRCGYVVTSFDRDILLRLHSLDKNIPLGYVWNNRAAGEDWAELPVSVVLPRYDLVTKPLVEQAHRFMRKVFTWTVNRERDLLRLADWGVDGLISDNPKLLNRLFGMRRSAE